MGDINAPDFSTPSLDSSLVPEVDRTYGFLGLKLETPLTRVSGMEFYKQQGALAVYRRPTDSLQVGQAHVAYIEYWFEREILRTIALGFDNLKAGTQLRDAFSRVYGRGFGSEQLVSWRGAHAQIIYKIIDKEEGLLVISTLHNVTPDDAELLLDINVIAGRGPDEVAVVLGPPNWWETVRLGGVAHRKAYYQDGYCEIIYILDVADWITINPRITILASKDAIKLLGLPNLPPSFDYGGKLTWNNIANLRSVDFNFGPSGALQFIHVRYRTKQ